MKAQIKYLQNLFYDLLNDFGRVFIIIRYSDRTTIGKRGFTEEEKEKGLVLIFNNENYKALHWTEDGSIITTLGFGSGNRPENCFIHCDDIVAVYSPDARIKLDRWDMGDVENSSVSGQETIAKKDISEGKIVSLDRFRKVKT
ncbi:MAG: hypothetical protein HY754_02785 [Nitrospirae bacterium]|nr:hypothetical protein [Nitrospirota bacterium]